MKHFSATIVGALSLGFAATSCCQQAPAPEAEAVITSESVVLKDYGAEPTVLNIEDYTLANEDFRTTLWTGTQMQITLMSIPVGGEIGLEQHVGLDQFLRIEQGEGQVVMGDSRENLDFVREVSDDDVIIVPSGKWHNLTNKGDKPMKIYSIYTPVEHPHGTIHKTQQEAAEAEHHH